MRSDDIYCTYTLIESMRINIQYYLCMLAFLANHAQVKDDYVLQNYNLEPMI